MSKKNWFIFALVQLVGITCIRMSGPPYTVLRYRFVLSGLALLQPGLFLGLGLSEKLLWRSGLMLQEMSTIGLATAILINLIAWYLAAKGLRKLQKTSLQDRS